MREIKIQVVFKTHNAQMEPELNRHHTTLDRLMTGVDKFPYDTANIVAKRQFTGFKDIDDKEIYEGDKMLSIHDDGECNYIGTVTWFREWAGWAIVDDNGTPECFGEKDSGVALYHVNELQVCGEDLASLHGNYS